jgi:hypothetical protein
MTKLRFVAAILIALVIGVIWGELAHRSRFFPHPQLRSLAVFLDLVDENPTWNLKSKSTVDLEALVELGYLESAYDPRHRERGVLHVDEKRVFPGVRFYTSEASKKAFLIDVDGEVLHDWEHSTSANWEFARLLPDGGIVARHKGGFTRLTRDSELVWTVRVSSHHDLCLFEDQIYALTQETVSNPSVHGSNPTVEHFVARYTLDGEFIDRISLFDVIERSSYRFLLPSIDHLEFRGEGHARDAKLDIIHSNHVEVFDGSLAHLGNLYRRGNILVCVRQLNFIMVFDPDSLEILWLWGPSNLVYPHHPVPTDNGGILLFNNGRQRSEVLEVDPLSYRIEWRYSEEGFFSKRRGGAHRLPNGNTLITESDRGRVLEVTVDGDVVWRFANPDVKEDGRRGVIHCMTAYPPDATPFIASVTGS